MQSKYEDWESANVILPPPCLFGEASQNLRTWQGVTLSFYLLLPEEATEGINKHKDANNRCRQVKQTESTLRDFDEKYKVFSVLKKPTSLG